MTAVAESYLDAIAALPANGTLVLRDVTWEDYENLLDEVGEASGLRISYDAGVIKIMTLSTEHEGFALFTQDLVRLISLRRRIEILCFGSATIKRRPRDKGAEPDACFYIQSAPLLGNKLRIDFNTDPPPDVVVEIDIHHESLDKFPIYAGLGMPEIWRYDGWQCEFYALENGAYQKVETSRALPLLTSATLGGFLNRVPQEGQYETLLAAEEWLAGLR
jgi:Uma2 family endonuclease